MIIDFRVRPPRGGFLQAQFFRDSARTARICRSQRLNPPRSLLEADWEVFLAEFDASGIDLAVVPGRRADPRFGQVPNEDVAQIVREGGGRFVGFGAVDVYSPSAVEDLERAVLELGLKGLALDPGFCNPPLYPDDQPLRPLYERCLQLGVPAMITVSGRAGPDIGYADPVRVDRLAASYPDLPIVVAHAGWPFIMAMLAVADRRPNLWISPDQYAVNLPAAQHLVEAANSFLGDRLIFGSSYPFLPMKEALESYRALPFLPEVVEGVLGGNARRLLGLTQR